MLQCAQVKARLGDAGFALVRAKVMAQQEVFVQQMYEMHRVATRQRHLQMACERPHALRAEIALQVPSLLPCSWVCCSYLFIASCPLSLGPGMLFWHNRGRAGGGGGDFGCLRPAFFVYVPACSPVTPASVVHTPLLVSVGWH